MAVDLRDQDSRRSTRGRKPLAAKIDRLFARQTPQPLPRGRKPAGVDSSDNQRHRLLTSLAYVMAEKGYSGATVSMITSRARVSRRTFYELFADKEEALICAYDLAGSLLLDQIREDISGITDWQERLVTGVRSYLAAMGAHPEVTKVFLLESISAGEMARSHRDAVHSRWSSLLIEEVRRARMADSTLARTGLELTPALARATVSGFESLVLDALRRGDHPSTMTQPCLVVLIGSIFTFNRDFARLVERSCDSSAVRAFLTRASSTAADQSRIQLAR